MKNDLLPTCDFQISLTINCESTWPSLTGSVMTLFCICIHIILYFPFKVFFTYDKLKKINPSANICYCYYSKTY